MKIKKVALFGDSILRGVVLDGNNRYCFSKDIDWAYIEKTLGVSIVNKSRFGCEITKGQKLLDDFLLAPQGADAVVIEYGGNDSDFLWNEVASTPDKKHLSKTDIAVFRQKLDCMVKGLKARGIQVILMSLPPLDADRYLKWISRGSRETSDSIMRFLGDVSRIYRYQEIYSNAVVKVALQNGCDLVDVRERFLRSEHFPDLMCADGIHPNERGQQVIVEAFVDYFSAAKLAKAN